MIEYRLKMTFDKYYEAPIEAWKYFVDMCEEMSFDKNERIKESGKRDSYGYFLLEGAVYLQNDFKNNYHICHHFYLSKFFLCSRESNL